MQRTRPIPGISYSFPAPRSRCFLSHRPVVAVLDQVIGAHRPVQAGRQDRVALPRGELQSRHLAGMLRERSEAEAVLGGPELDLAVVTARRQEVPIWRVGNRVQIEEVALLLQHVGLALPLPHKELALLLARHADPVTGCVDRDAIDLVLGDLERVDGVQSVEVVQAEHAVRLADHEDHFA